MRRLGYAASTVAFIAVAGVVTACEGNRLAGLETTGSATLRVTKKSTKEQQIETIKREMAREGVSPERAASVETALVNVPEVQDDIEQAVFLLAALSEALAAPGADVFKCRRRRNPCHLFSITSFSCSGRERRKPMQGERGN